MVLKMDWIKMVSAVLKLIPDIIDAIKAIEKAIPEPDQGAKKLEIIKTAFVAVGKSAEEIWPHVKTVIAGLVLLFNATNVFSTTKKEIVQ